jgi:hypothetical protein
MVKPRKRYRKTPTMTNDVSVPATPNSRMEGRLRKKRWRSTDSPQEKMMGGSR